MGRLSIHEAHQHHSALTLQEYKRLPPARLSSSSFSPLYLLFVLLDATQLPPARLFVLLTVAAQASPALRPACC
jgi:hypothetical protein